MKKLVKRNLLKNIILIIIFIVVLFIIIKNISDKKNYGKDLWNRLSTGDVSSIQCKAALDKYSNENLSNGSNSLDSFYSYKKKRCLGLDSRFAMDSQDRTKTVSVTDTIFDLITRDIIVSCNATNYPDSKIITCHDIKNNWEVKRSDSLMPPPFPISFDIYFWEINTSYPISSTWITLKELGKE